MTTSNNVAGDKRRNWIAALLIGAAGCVLTILLIGVVLWAASDVLFSTIISTYVDEPGDWSRAAQSVPFPIYQPAKLPDDSGTASVRVLSPGGGEDAGQVVEASYESGLRLSERLEPSGDPLPPGVNSQPATIVGADSAFFYVDTAGAPTRRLLVRKGATTITLWGATDEELVESAESLRPPPSVD